MQREKRQRKIIFLIEIIVILLIIETVIFLSNNKKQELSQDILFLRLFSNTNYKEHEKNSKISQKNIQINNKEDEQIESFDFTVDYKNTKMQSKEVELANTILNKMLVQEKIAPRSKRNIWNKNKE